MVTVCWAAKGGSGTTVVAATLALGTDRPSLLVDLDGELPAVLGLAEPERPGVVDWMSSDAPPEHLADLLTVADRSTWLLAHRLGHRPPDRSPLADERLPDLLAWLRDWEHTNGGDVVVDAGTGEPSAALLRAERSLLVTRNCYLAVDRAARCAHPPGGIVLVEEPRRSLAPHDIEQAVGAPIVARVRWDPDLARAVDAGLLRSRTPKAIDRAVRRAAA